MIVQTMSSTRVRVPRNQLVFGAGTLGCTATQEQANMVARQLQMISQRERSSQSQVASGTDTARAVKEMIELDGSGVGIQPACRERYKVAKMDSMDYAEMLGP